MVCLSSLLRIVKKHLFGINDLKIILGVSGTLVFAKFLQTLKKASIHAAFESAYNSDRVITD